MSLCLMNVHGDIEGDYEFVCDIPNGTNGEVIQALFPNSKFTKMGYGNIEFAVDGFVFELTDRWLNAPYVRKR